MRVAADHRPAEPRRTAFDRDGFVVLERWITSGEQKALRSDIDRLLLTPHGLRLSCSRPNNVLLPLRWSDATVRRLMVSQRRVQTIREAVGASDLRWISGYVSIKEPRSGPLPWHQDWWCWDHPVTFRRAAPQVAVLCYLAATDREHGALRVLPGSHLRSSAIHAYLAPEQRPAADDPEPGHTGLSDHPEQLTLQTAAGDAVVVDYRLLHGTHANSRDLRRDCVILNFAPSWRDLPEDIRGHLISHCALPAPGEVLPSWPSWESNLLPRYTGIRRDLPLRRSAPLHFQIVK